MPICKRLFLKYLIFNPTMKYLFYLILLMLPATGFSQANVRKALQKVEKASDIGMSVTNVVRRNPNNRKIEMKVFTVDNLQPKYVREIAKAMEKDADNATYFRSESANGTVVRVERFTSNKSDLNVILTYGPGGRTLVVREDFTTTKKSKQQQRSTRKSKNSGDFFDFSGFNGLKSLEDLNVLEKFKELNDLIVINQQVSVPVVSVYKYNYNYNSASNPVVEITGHDGVTHIYLNNI